jgi:hypothetical protein
VLVNRTSKPHQRVIGIINVAENRSPGLIGRLIIGLYIVARPRWGRIQHDDRVGGCDNERQQDAAEHSR